MNIHIKNQLAETTTLSRRSLLQGGAAFALGIYLAPRSNAFAQAPAAPAYNIAPNTFLVIKSDNTVT
ncbi:MAG: hypothetical protein ACRCTX_26930, partial [Afipia sp.]